jgi:hypothetical protein
VLIGYMRVSKAAGSQTLDLQRDAASGTARSRSSSYRMKLISPSVWRCAKRNTARSVRAVTIARSE